MPPKTILKKITARAKQLQREKGSSWRAALKAAGREYRSGTTVKTKKVKAVKQKSTTRKPTKKTTAEGYLKKARALFLNQLANLEGRKLQEKTKTKKKAVQKKINAVRAKIRRLI